MEKIDKRLGFTLIELMISVAVISILAAISYPSYTKYLVRGKRAEGRATLMDAAARMESYYSDNNRYTNADNTLPPGIGTSSENGHYSLSVTASGTYQTYVLAATPATFTDDECGTLTLTQAGVKSVTGTAPIPDCWVR